MSKYSIHIDRQNNKQSIGYRVRVINKDYPSMSKALTKSFKTKEEAEQHELFCYRFLQFIKEEL